MFVNCNLQPSEIRWLPLRLWLQPHGPSWACSCLRVWHSLSLCLESSSSPPLCNRCHLLSIRVSGQASLPRHPARRRLCPPKTATTLSPLSQALPQRGSGGGVTTPSICVGSDCFTVSTGQRPCAVSETRPQKGGVHKCSQQPLRPQTGSKPNVH